MSFIEVHLELVINEQQQNVYWYVVIKVKYFKHYLLCRFVKTRLFGGFVCLRLKTGSIVGATHYSRDVRKG